MKKRHKKEARHEKVEGKTEIGKVEEKVEEKVETEKAVEAEKKAEEKKPEEKKVEAEPVIKIHKKHIVRIGYIAIVLLLIASVFAVAKFGLLENILPTVKGPAKAVRFDLYVMSQCPYGTQVEDALKPVMDELGDSVELNIEFIAAEPAEGNFQSMHGQAEVEGDIIHLCAEKYYPKSFLNFIVCQNKNPSDFKSTIDSCAEENKMDASRIKACAEGEDGKQLLSESIRRVQQVGARGSPTIYINNQSYSGRRDENSFIRAICAYLEKHPACENIPECASDMDCQAKEGLVPVCENPDTGNAKCTYQKPIEVQMTVLTDKNCRLCDPSVMVDVLKTRVFLNVREKYVDVSSEEGRQLIASMAIKNVPAYIFSSNVAETYAWRNDPRLKTAFEQKGNLFRMLDEVAEASYPIDESARQQVYSKLGIVRNDNKPQIDFFVMSYCPYGNMAEELIEKVYNVLGGKAEFKPHYVIYSNYGGSSNCLDAEQKYCSMHGVQEMNQDIREFCVNKHFGIKDWFRFAIAMNTKCNSQNADTCWTGVAGELALDSEKIKACEKNEGTGIAKAEKELNDLLGVSGSPTIFIDGEQYSGQRTVQAVLDAVCMFFDTKPSECSAEISGTAATQTVPSGGCGA